MKWTSKDKMVTSSLLQFTKMSSDMTTSKAKIAKMKHSIEKGDSMRPVTAKKILSVDTTKIQNL